MGRDYEWYDNRMQKKEKGYKLEQLLQDSFDKRESMRFDAKSHTLGEISLTLDADEFSSRIQGPIINESFTGCCMLTDEIHDLEAGHFARIKVGELGPYICQVRWILIVEPGVYKLGIRYQE